MVFNKIVDASNCINVRSRNFSDLKLAFAHYWLVE